MLDQGSADLLAADIAGYCNQANYKTAAIWRSIRGASVQLAWQVRDLIGDVVICHSVVIVQGSKIAKVVAVGNCDLEVKSSSCLSFIWLLVAANC